MKNKSCQYNQTCKSVRCMEEPCKLREYYSGIDDRLKEGRFSRFESIVRKYEGNYELDNNDEIGGGRK